ncbi:MAG: ribonuclease H family protein [Agrococcus casei]|uniref:ribonuclease H family protein n=1 Tax=Agrococcus casei TaxID=343512 RepID=UPI003F93DBDA
MTLIAAADGSALGNPGPGGWAWFIDESRWASGGWPTATNNQGELQAVIDLLTQAADEPDLHILLDSQYVLKSATVWIAGWKRKGWKKSDGKPVLNVEMMQELDALLESRRSAGFTTEFEWVKGHAGHTLNERADDLAQAAARAFQAGRTAEQGPGLSPSAASAPSATQPAAPPAAHDDEAPMSLFDDDLLEPATREERFEPADDLRLTVWRDVRTHEVMNFSIEQLGGEGWAKIG